MVDAFVSVCESSPNDVVIFRGMIFSIVFASRGTPAEVNSEAVKFTLRIDTAAELDGTTLIVLVNVYVSEYDLTIFMMTVTDNVLSEYSPVYPSDKMIPPVVVAELDA